MRNIKFQGQSQVIDNTPLCSFDDIEREGIVTIKPAKPNQFKSESITFTGFKGKHIKNADSKDASVREERFWFGIPIGINDDGSRKFKKIQIIDGRMYYLSNPEDAKEWHILRHHFAVQGSPNIMGRPRWIVEIESDKAKANINKATGFMAAFNFINSMSDNKLKDFSRLFEMDPSNSTVEIIKGTLVGMAMEKPSIFVPYMEDNEKTSISEIFERSLAANEIAYAGNDRGYIYNGVPIGLSKELAIDYLRKKPDMLATLDVLSRQQFGLINNVTGDKPNSKKEKSESDTEPKSPKSKKTEVLPGLDNF